MTRQGPLRRERRPVDQSSSTNSGCGRRGCGDYVFALSLYLEGAERHSSKIGQWNRPRIVSKFRQGYKRAPARSHALETSRSARFRSPTSSTTCTCGSFISLRMCAGKGSARSSSRSCSARGRAGEVRDAQRHRRQPGAASLLAPRLPRHQPGCGEAPDDLAPATGVRRGEPVRCQEGCTLDHASDPLQRLEKSPR